MGREDEDLNHDSGSTDQILQSAELCDAGTVVKLSTPVVFGSAASPRPLVATHKGRMTIPSCCVGVEPIVLDDCYIVPNIPCNLISGVKLRKAGYVQLIDTDGFLWVYRRVNGKVEACCGFREIDERFVLIRNTSSDTCKAAWRALQGMCQGGCTSLKAPHFTYYTEDVITDEMDCKGDVQALLDAVDLIHYGVDPIVLLDGFDYHEMSPPMLVDVIGAIDGKKMHNRLHFQSLEMSSWLQMVDGFSAREKKQLLADAKHVKGHDCPACIQGKMQKATIRKRRTPRSTEKNFTVHADLKSMSTSKGGFRYYCVLSDEGSGFLSVSLMKKKSEARDVFARYLQWARCQQDTNVKNIRCDNAKEFLGKLVVNELTREFGVNFVNSAPYDARTNGLAESYVKLSSVLAMVLLFKSGLQAVYWPLALKHAVMLVNLLPSPRHPGKTRYEVWFGYRPNLRYLRAFGCYGYAPVHTAHKEERRADKAIYVGVGNSQLEYYRVLNADSKKERIVGRFISDESTFYETAQETAVVSVVIPSELEDTAYASISALVDDAEDDDDLLSTNPFFELGGTELSESKYDSPSEHESDDTYDHDGADGHIEENAIRELGSLRRRASKHAPSIPHEVNEAKSFDKGKVVHSIESIAEYTLNDSGYPIVCVNWGSGEQTWEPADVIATGAPIWVDEAREAFEKSQAENDKLTALEESVLEDKETETLVNDDVEEEEKLDEKEIPLLAQHLVLENPYVDKAMVWYTREILELSIPDTYEEMMNMKGNDDDAWVNYSLALQHEYRCHLRMGTFELVAASEMHPHEKLIKTKLIFDVKLTEVNGEIAIERYKARLTAKGFSQEKGVNYNEVFAPVVSYDSLKIMVAAAVLEKQVAEAFDFVTAFLQAEMHERVFMAVPPGFVDFIMHDLPEDTEQDKKLKAAYRLQYNKAWRLGGGKIVCRLRRAIPGLKQASKCWYDRIVKFLKEEKFKPCPQEPCVFFRMFRGKKQRLSLLVDDGMIYGEDLGPLKSKMSQVFSVKWLGPVHIFAGIKFTWNEHGVQLDQKMYVEKLGKKYANLIDDIPAPSIPLNEVLLPDGKGEGDALLEDKEQYRTVVGSLLFATRITIPEVMFSVNQCCRFFNAPRRSHYEAALRILKYVVVNKDDLTICYTRNCTHKGVVALSDSEFAGIDLEYRRSFFGYVIYLAGGPVVWAAKQLPFATRGVGQAEFVALSYAAEDVLAVRNVLKHIQVIDHVKEPSIICGDNTAAIGTAKGEMSGKRMKHLEMSYHLVRDYVLGKEVEVIYVKTQLQIADIFTKALPRVLFQRFAKMLRGNPNGRSLFDAFVKGILENGKYLVVDGNEIRLEP